MSDLLSPLLVTMNDESHAYICFCALMQRLKKNFLSDGIAMTQKFQHLSEGLLYYDPEFYAYLKRHQVSIVSCHQGRSSEGHLVNIGQLCAVLQ